MGFNLWDIGAVATGAIERDREVTKENLLIRADELKAKRDSVITFSCSHLLLIAPLIIEYSPET